MNLLLLQADVLLHDWVNLGFGGIIASMFFFMVRHLVNSQVRTNQLISESIRELPTVLNEQKNAYEKGFLMLHETMKELRSEIKEIKSKI